MTLQVNTKDNNYLTPRLETQRILNLAQALTLLIPDLTPDPEYIPAVRSTGNNVRYLSGRFTVGATAIAMNDVIATLPTSYFANTEYEVTGTLFSGGTRSPFFIELSGKEVRAKSTAATGDIVIIDNITYFSE